MEDMTKHRKIKLKEPCHNGLVEKLAQINGVLEVKAETPSSLQISYDLMRTNLEAIEKTLKEQATQLSNSFINRFARGWIKFIEDNERTNIKAVPHCCSEEPRRE